MKFTALTPPTHAAVMKHTADDKRRWNNLVLARSKIEDVALEDLGKKIMHAPDWDQIIDEAQQEENAHLFGSVPLAAYDLPPKFVVWNSETEQEEVREEVWKAFKLWKDNASASWRKRRKGFQTQIERAVSVPGSLLNAASAHHSVFASERTVLPTDAYAASSPISPGRGTAKLSTSRRATANVYRGAAISSATASTVGSSAEDDDAEITDPEEISGADESEQEISDAAAVLVMLGQRNSPTNGKSNSSHTCNTNLMPNRI